MPRPFLKTTLLLGVAFVALPAIAPLAATPSPAAPVSCLHDPSGNFVNEKGNLLNKEEVASCLDTVAPAAGDDDGPEETAEVEEEANEQNGNYDEPEAQPETPQPPPEVEEPAPSPTEPPSAEPVDEPTAEPVDEQPVESPGNPSVDDPPDQVDPETPPTETREEGLEEGPSVPTEIPETTEESGSRNDV